MFYNNAVLTYYSLTRKITQQILMQPPSMGNTVLIHMIGQKPRTELNLEKFVLFMNYIMTLDSNNNF